MSERSDFAASEIRAEQLRIIADHGAWTDHNIHLGVDVFTISPDLKSEKLRRITQIVQDLLGAELASSRVLDLGCLEGGYSIELGRRGATVVGIEGRSSNLEKSLFSQRVLNLDRVRFIPGDIRQIDAAVLGQFDLILCLGVLYHLEAADVLALIRRMYGMCNRAVIIDTHVSTAAQVRYSLDTIDIFGREVAEHDPGLNAEEKIQDLWASLDNNISFWPTKESLFNMLIAAGFTTVFECVVPFEARQPADRITVVALKGQPVSGPTMAPAATFPKSFERMVSRQQTWRYRVVHSLTASVPLKARRRIKLFLRALGIISRKPKHWERPWKSVTSTMNVIDDQ